MGWRTQLRSLCGYIYYICNSGSFFSLVWCHLKVYITLSAAIHFNGNIPRIIHYWTSDIQPHALSIFIYTSCNWRHFSLTHDHDHDHDHDSIVFFSHSDVFLHILLLTKLVWLTLQQPALVVSRGFHKEPSTHWINSRWLPDSFLKYMRCTRCQVWMKIAYLGRGGGGWWWI